MVVYLRAHHEWITNEITAESLVRRFNHQFTGEDCQWILSSSVQFISDEMR